MKVEPFELPSAKSLDDDGEVLQVVEQKVRTFSEVAEQHEEERGGTAVQDGHDQIDIRIFCEDMEKSFSLGLDLDYRGQLPAGWSRSRQSQPSSPSATGAPPSSSSSLYLIL